MRLDAASQSPSVGCKTPGRYQCLNSYQEFRFDLGEIFVLFILYHWAYLNRETSWRFLQGRI